MKRPLVPTKPATISVSTPCKLCPFRKDVMPYIRQERVRDIWQRARRYGEHFVCHETVNYNERGYDNKRRACAGFMLMARKEGIDSNLTIVQLAERLAGVRFNNLRGAGLVYPSIRQMLHAYRREK